MIYECPNCHAPQPAGSASCHECGAEFDGPVPADAILPEGGAAPPLPPAAPPAFPAAPPGVTPAEAEAPRPAPPPAAPLVEEVRPPEPAFVPYQEAPAEPGGATSYQAPPTLPAYTPPPAYAPPAYTPPPAYAPPAYTPPPPYTPAPARGGLQKALLIGLPVLLVLVLGGAYFVRGLDPAPDTTAPASAPTPVAPPAPTAPATPGTPMVLNGSMSGGGDAVDPKAKLLVGRWQDKKTSFYVFNGNGTGYRGSTTGDKQQEAFVWVLTQNQLILYANKQEKLAFTPGPNEATIYLRDEAGRYIQFARANT